MYHTGSSAQDPSDESWDILKKRAWHTGIAIEEAISKLSKSNDEKEVSLVEEKLRELAEVIRKLDACKYNGNSTGKNNSDEIVLRKFTNQKNDLTEQLVTIKRRMRETRNRRELLNDVHGTIRSSQMDTQSSNIDSYLAERSRVENSHNMVDVIIGQAVATRDEIGRQRRQIESFNSRAKGVLGNLPVVNSLIRRINTRRKRDTLIMAGVISTCIILICLYWLRT